VTRDGTSLEVAAEDEVDDVEAVWRRGGRGRKLQEPGARVDTRWKISAIRRCWTDVS
jgi:hypothetical protein